MKKIAKELESKEVFTTTAKVLMLRDGDASKPPVEGKQITDLRFEYFAKLRGVRYAWCKLAHIPGKLFILVPVDAECEVK